METVPVRFRVHGLTVRIPSSLQAQMTRTAILAAISDQNFLEHGLTWLHGEQALPRIPRGRPFSTSLLTITATHLGFDLVHQLHRFDDADNLTPVEHSRQPSRRGPAPGSR